MRPTLLLLLSVMILLGAGAGVLTVTRLAPEAFSAPGTLTYADEVAPLPLRIDSVTPSAASVPQYHKLELRVRFTGVVTDYFDPARLDLSASVRTPSGRTFRIPGFLARLDLRAPAPPEPVWLVRFTPIEVGRYDFTVTVDNGRASADSPLQSVMCTKNETSPGFVRISPLDHRFFQLDDGTFFFPVGQNVCWARDYEPYFRKMHAAGENFVRVWICPWNCWLERTDSLGRVDLDAAGRLDDILTLADKHGLRVQLVLLWHGLLSSEAWARNPYNAANGGPCAAAADFFTDPSARKLFQRQLRYLVARYSWSPSLLGWELVNEVDLADNRNWDDLVDWHRAMAHCLLTLDPHRDLVTTSTFSPRLESLLYALPEVTFCAPHRYQPDPVASVCDAASDDLVHGKPVFLAEYGSNATREGQSEIDPGGVLLHAALWSSFHSPAAGAASPWWWDTHIEANNLYTHFAALSAYAAGFDRRQRRFQLLKSDLAGPKSEKLALQGLLDSAGGSLWLYEKGLLAQPRTPNLSRVAHGTSLTLTGLLDGPFDVVCWDTRAAKPITTTVIPCREGRLVLTLPGFLGDLAVKLTRQGPSLPAIEPPAAPETPKREIPLKQ